jgi:hypothetical protein
VQYTGELSAYTERVSNYTLGLVVATCVLGLISAASATIPCWENPASCNQRVQDCLHLTLAQASEACDCRDARPGNHVRLLACVFGIDHKDKLLAPSNTEAAAEYVAHEDVGHGNAFRCDSRQRPHHSIWTLTGGSGSGSGFAPLLLFSDPSEEGLFVDHDLAA